MTNLKSKTLRLALRTILTKNPKSETKMINPDNVKPMMMPKQLQLRQAAFSLQKTWLSSQKPTSECKSNNQCRPARSRRTITDLLSSRTSLWTAMANSKCRCSRGMPGPSWAPSQQIPRWMRTSQPSSTTLNINKTQSQISLLPTNLSKLFFTRLKEGPSRWTMWHRMLAT